MKKNKKTNTKKTIDDSRDFIDKLASLKYASKKDSKLMSSIVSSVLKKKIIVLLLDIKKNTTLMPIAMFPNK